MFTTKPADVARVEVIDELLYNNLPTDAREVYVKANWEVKTVNGVDELVPVIDFSYKT